MTSTLKYGQWAVLFLMWAGAAVPQSANQSSSITGTLHDENGTVVNGAIVIVTGAADGFGNGSSPNASAKSGADGSFTVPTVPNGTHQICVQVPASVFLNPCQWSLAPPTATTASGQAIQAGVIQLKKGFPLSVQVIDDTGDLKSNEGKTPGAAILIGAWNHAGLFQAARLKGKDSKNHFYELVVPYDTQLKLVVQSSFFNLSDQSGALVDPTKGSTMPVKIPAGSAIGAILYHVKGVVH